jgi:hypothetical protein
MLVALSGLQFPAPVLHDPLLDVALRVCVLPCSRRDPSLPINRNEITRFPHAVLEVKLSLGQGQESPAWVQVRGIAAGCSQGLRCIGVLAQWFRAFMRGEVKLSLGQGQESRAWVQVLLQVAAVLCMFHLALCSVMQSWRSTRVTRCIAVALHCYPSSLCQLFAGAAGV